MNVKVFNIRLNKDCFQEDQNSMNEFLNSVDVKLSSANFVTTETLGFWSVVIIYEEKIGVVNRIKEQELEPEEKIIFIALKQWRNDLAEKLGWSAFRVCHNSHLISIAKIKPQTLDELKNIKSFGERRSINYGDDIISLLNAI
jgi:superfamily II DNA helicase RecQ